MAKCQELFRREVPICPLIAEEHPDDCSDGECIEDQGNLPRRKTDAGQIGED